MRSPSPAAERVAGALGELVAATLADDAARAGEILADIGQRRIQSSAPAAPMAAKVAVHRRDSWTSAAAAPGRSPRPCYGSSRRYTPRSSRPPQLESRAGSPGLPPRLHEPRPRRPRRSWRRWLEQADLVTACWPCSAGKADLRLEEVGWALLSEADVRGDWDGLSGATDGLWERAGRPDMYTDWRRALSS